MSIVTRTQLNSVFFLIGLIAIPVVGAARDKDDPLMPTPVMYSEEHIDPFLHLAPVLKTANSKVFYATNRNSQSKGGKTKYGKGIVDVMSVGEGMVRFGDEGMTWAEIDEASKAPDPRENPIPMYLTSASEIAQFHDGEAVGDDATLTAEQQKFVDAINAELKVVGDDQILIYVHGAKFTFESALAQTAEVNHFAGRDMVGVAYVWPSHKDIIAYGFGVDVRRADHSGPILADLIELLATHTDRPGDPSPVLERRWAHRGPCHRESAPKVPRPDLGATPEENPVEAGPIRRGRRAVGYFYCRSAVDARHDGPAQCVAVRRRRYPQVRRENDEGRTASRPGPGRHDR